MSEAQLPKKLSARGLSILFGVSEQRISQLKRKGQLKPDSANMYDVAEAKALRGFQLSEHGVRVIGQEYSNGTGKVSPAKVNALNGVPQEAETVTVDMSTVAPSPSSTFAAQTRISELREQKLQAELDRARTRARREAGELVERAQVQSSYVAAGALIASILQNLPAEIAAIFADPATKAEVRLKVQTRIDQTHHALYSALKDFGKENAD